MFLSGAGAGSRSRSLEPEPEPGQSWTGSTTLYSSVFISVPVQVLFQMFYLQDLDPHLRGTRFRGPPLCTQEEPIQKYSMKTSKSKEDIQHVNQFKGIVSSDFE